MNRFKAILDWLKGYDLKYKWIDFNVIPVNVGNMAVSSVSSEREVASYINGQRLVDLTFAIVLVCDYSTGTGDTNIDAMTDYLNLMAWIEEQDAQGNYPDIDDSVHYIKALQLAPIVTADQSLEKAIYQGQFTMRYLEEKK
jgi:hypothetical protein